MDPKDFERFAKAHDGEVVLVKFSDGGNSLFKIYSSDDSGGVEFYQVEVDPQELPIGGTPYGFDSNYVEDLIPLVDEKVWPNQSPTKPST